MKFGFQPNLWLKRKPAHLFEVGCSGFLEFCTVWLAWQMCLCEGYFPVVGGFFVLDISWTVEKSISVLSGFYLYLILKTCHYLHRYAILGCQGWSITHFYHPNQLLERWELRKFCFILELICLVTCCMCFICLFCIWHNYSQLVSRNGWLLKFSVMSLQMRSELLLLSR
jgi:hypothetical protein